MNTDVPYLPATGNLPKILDKIQNAGAPDTFTVQFLKDLGFTASQDRPTPKLLKYLGMLDSNGRPTASYKAFMDSAKAKSVLASRLKVAYDDLFTADRNAHAKSAEHLKGWFKTKTGASDSVADKYARTFKVLATYADFNAPVLPQEEEAPVPGQGEVPAGNGAEAQNNAKDRRPPGGGNHSSFGLVYRFEIHLPDTQNVDTFRAIFRALREELM